MSDPRAEISGASLSVGVGSYQDDARVPGVAHLHEHMLFLGSKRYPNRTDFIKLTQKGGGDFNAFTSGTETNYFYRVGKDDLEESLKMFSQFFISPLFDRTQMDKEILNIEAEYRNTINSDTWKTTRAFQLITPEGSISNRFLAGNFKTLSEIPKQNNIDVSLLV